LEGAIAFLFLEIASLTIEKSNWGIQELKLMSQNQQEFYVIIERDEDGYYIGEVPQFQGCYSQGETLDELMVNIKEAIELCLEEESKPPIDFVGIQKVIV
jgi:predicted RNase H-like HicB family nuclease